MKWELVDMGSLNGTLLNSKPINHQDTGSRNWGNPMNLTNGDIITLGTTSKVMVSIRTESPLKPLPLFFCLASDYPKCKAYIGMHDISNEKTVCRLNKFLLVIHHSEFSTPPYNPRVLLH